MKKLYFKIALCIISLLALFGTNTYSQTNISGHITASTTWQKAKGPYKIGIEATIDQGVTITIESGTEVILSYRACLIIDGTLIASGIKVYNDNSTADMYGSGFSFTAKSSGSSLDNVTFQKVGGSPKSGAVEISSSSVTVKNCLFSNVKSAIAVLNKANPDIQNCIIENGSGTGLYIISGSPTVSNLSFKSTTGYPIYITGADCQPVITGCTITGGTELYEKPFVHPMAMTKFGNNNFSDILLISSQITNNSKWPSNYNYTFFGDITIAQGGILTIDPITNIDLYNRNSLLVDGTLIAMNVNISCSLNDTTKFGGSIVFNKNSINSVLDNVVIDKAGNPMTSINSAITINSSSVSIKNSIIKNTYQDGIGIYNSANPEIENTAIEKSRKIGLHIISGSPVVKQLNVSNCFDYAIQIDCKDCQPVISETTLSGTGKRGKVLAQPGSLTKFGLNIFTDIDLKGETIMKNCTLPPNFNYQFQGNITVDTNKVLTIIAGTQIDLASGKNLIVNGTLKATGKGQGITRFYSSVSDTNVFGGGINFAANSKNSVMENILFEKTGKSASNDAISINNSNVEINNCIIKNCGYYGIKINNKDCKPIIRNTTVERSRSYGIYIYHSSPVIDNLTITNSRNYAIYIEGQDAQPEISNCTFNGTKNGLSMCSDPASLNKIGINKFRNITLTGNKIESNITLPASYNYQPKSNLIIDTNFTLTILPGTDIDLYSTFGQIDIEIFGTLKAEGTQQNKIRFYCSKADTYGGGLYFMASGLNSLLKNVTMEKIGAAYTYIGNNNYTQVMVIKTSSLTLNNCLITGSYHYGVVVQGNSSPTIQNTIIEKSYYGIYADASSPKIINCSLTDNEVDGLLIMGATTKSYVPKISNCIFANNKGFGIKNYGPETADATYCWWGDATGPYHSQNNPSGKCNWVSDFVKFNPWLGKKPTGPVARIKVSYFINSVETFVDTITVKLTEDAGNLFFKDDINSINKFIDIPFIKNTFINSKTFIIQDTVYNDDFPYYFITKPFEINETGNFNIICKYSIVSIDSKLDDNIAVRPAEIWLADFKYGVDNYNFFNWDFSAWEVGQFFTNYLFSPYYVGPRVINELLTATNGHCFGMASSSIIFKQNRHWIPDNPALKPTYQQPETFKLKEKIRDAHYKQVGSIYLYTFSLPFVSDHERAISELQNIKDILSQNKLALANYEHHSTVLHTMIKHKNYYQLYEYNNNEGEFDFTKYSSDNRGRFKIYNNNHENELIFSGNSALYRFEIADFSLAKSNKGTKDINSVLDSLMQLQLDTLVKNKQNMIIYKQYRTGDSVPLAKITISTGVVKAYDYGGYKVFYLDNKVQPDINIISNNNEPGAFSLMGINTFDKTKNNVSQFLYENVFLQLPVSKVKFTKVFNDSLQKCDIDENGDKIYEFNIKQSYTGKIPSSLNLPPSLIRDIRLIALNAQIDSMSIDLKDFIEDELINSLTYKLNFNDTLIDCSIFGSTLTVKLKKTFKDLQIIELKVTDGTHNIIIPLYVSASSGIGINEYINNEISLYPNPANSRININLRKDSDLKEIEIFNLQGKFVFRNQFNHNKNKSLSIDVADYPKGIYIIRITTAKTAYTGKFIVN